MLDLDDQSGTTTIFFLSKPEFLSNSLMLPSPISVVYQCVTNYPKLNDIKQQPFYYALRFYGTGI